MWYEGFSRVGGAYASVIQHKYRLGVLLRALNGNRAAVRGHIQRPFAVITGQGEGGGVMDAVCENRAAFWA